VFDLRLRRAPLLKRPALSSRDSSRATSHNETEGGNYKALLSNKGGTLSIPGVYGGMLDKVPFGAAFGKGITMKMGQTNMHTYMKPLLERIEKRQIDPS
jgi:hypothetical protein